MSIMMLDLKIEKRNDLSAVSATELNDRLDEARKELRRECGKLRILELEKIINDISSELSMR
jgi:ribosomal protein L29